MQFLSLLGSKLKPRNQIHIAYREFLTWPHTPVCQYPGFVHSLWLHRWVSSGVAWPIHKRSSTCCQASLPAMSCTQKAQRLWVEPSRQGFEHSLQSLTTHLQPTMIKLWGRGTSGLSPKVYFSRRTLGDQHSPTTGSPQQALNTSIFPLVMWCGAICDAMGCDVVRCGVIDQNEDLCIFSSGFHWFAFIF